MPVPVNPTTLTACAHAARMAGLRNATSVSYAVYTYGPDWLESVKTQLWQASTQDNLLETTAVMLTQTGSRTVTNIPSDYDHDKTLRVFDASTDGGWRGTFQSVQTGATAVQLASNFDGSATPTLGSYVFTLSGMGAAQVRSIATFNETTKWATLDSAYTTAPTSTTTYCVGQFWWDLDEREQEIGLQLNGRPARYRWIATTCEVEPPSDVIYPILLFYGANLTRLDDGGSVFIKHLRERYTYWLQGLKVEAMGQFDDDRYTTELGRWGGLLANYGAKNVQSERATFSR